jgi:hypothetical protein
MVTDFLEPTDSKDIESGAELRERFAWFRDMLAVRPGKYGEIYQLWSGHPASRMGPAGWQVQPWNAADDRLLDDLGGIDFGPMQGDSQRFANLRGAAEEMRTGADSMRDRLYDAWSGPAADVALERFDQLGKAFAMFRDTTNQFAAALDAARNTTRAAIVNLRDTTIRTFELPGGVEFRRDQISRIDAASAGSEWAVEAINVLDAMCDSYCNAVEPLRKLLTDTSNAVAQSWGALEQILRRLQAIAAVDPFASHPAQAPRPNPGAQPGLGSQPAPAPAPPPAPGTPSTAQAAAAAGGGAPLPPLGGGGGGSGASTGSVGAAEAPMAQGMMTGVQQPSSSSADAPDARPAAPAGPGGPGGAPPGGGMMGGMGGMAGAGGGQGGDQERKASSWRVQGDLFDDALGDAIPMVIGDDDPYDNQDRP